MFFAPFASGYANNRFTSTVSASANLSNPDEISPCVGTLSSVPPANEAETIVFDVVKPWPLTKFPPAADVVGPEPALNAVLCPLHHTYCDKLLITSL